MIKAVIFDWGGVIAPIPQGGWLNVLATMLDSTAKDLLPHWRKAGYTDFSKGIIDKASFWHRFEQSLGKPLPKDVARIWVDGSALHPWPEMLSFITELKDKNIRVAILSNTVKPMSTLVHKTGIYDSFDPIVLSNEVGLTKPDAAIYQLTLDRLQLVANECVYVDDQQRNLVPAEAMGMVPILASHDPKRIIAAVKRAVDS